MDEEQQKSEFDIFKEKVFSFTYELVSNQINNNFYLCLIIVQSLQFIAYYSNGAMVWNTYGFRQFQYFAQYINLLKFLQKQNINLFLVPFFFCLNVVFIILLVVGFKAFEERTLRLRKEVANRNFHKNKVEFFINLMMVLYSTVLTIPMFQTSLTAFYCSADNPFTSIQNCYIDAHILIAILGVLNFVWLVVVSAYYMMYYYSRNPFSDNFMTCSNNWHSLGKLVIKIAPMIYMMYDPHFNFPVLFLVVMNLAYFGYLIVFSKFLFSFYRYNFKLDQKLFGIEVFVCIFNSNFILLFVFQDKAGQPSLLMLAWAVMSLLISLMTIRIAEGMKKNLVKSVNAVEKKTLPQILEYLIYLINDIEGSFRQGKGAFHLMNIARIHKEKCKDPKCSCEIFFREQKQQGYHKNKTVFYTLLLGLIDRILKHNKKAYAFVILKAYILFYKMQSQIKAATTISIVMSDKLDFSDDMLVKGLLFQLNEQYSDTRDMEIYRKFNQYLFQQEEESLSLTNLYLSYWEELLDQNSSIPKLQMTLRRIKESKRKLEEIVNGALNIFHNHVKILFLYMHLLKEVLNDPAGALKCEEKYKIGLKDSKLSNVDTVNKIQFRQNQNLLVINFTRNYSSQSQSLGKYKIVSISSNVKEFLGFNNSDLKNESINRLIPRIYHNVHDQFIDNILDRKNSDIQSRQIRVFPITSDGNIIQCNIISKFMPSLAHGINIVSFLEQCDKERDQFFIIYNSTTGIVDSLSAEGELLLKDQTQRKATNSIFVIPDNVNDLLPDWDYKEEQFRNEQTMGSKKKIMKSSKTFSNLNESNHNVDIKEVTIARSDGLENKFIKILRCRANYFGKMMSIENEDYQESNTMQKYLEKKKESMMSSQAEAQTLIQFQTKNMILGDREKHLQPKQQVKHPTAILASPPEGKRSCFVWLQGFLILGAIALSVFEFVTNNTTIHNFNSNIDLLVNLNCLQSNLAEATYITSLVSNQLAYTRTNMTLPYGNYSSQINLANELSLLRTTLNEIDNLVKKTGPLLVQKTDSQELSSSDQLVLVHYQVIEGSMQFYTKLLTFVQAADQYITFGRQLLYRIQTVNESISTIIPSSPFFYIYVNNLQILPHKLNTANGILLSKSVESVKNEVNNYFIIKLVILSIVFVTVVIVIVFYSYVLSKFVLKILGMYEGINLRQIQKHSDKCYKYKQALLGKEDKNSQDGPKRTQSSIRSVEINQLEEGDGRVLEEENEKLLEGEAKKDEDIQLFLSFQSKPTICKLSCSVLIWIVLYGILSAALMLTYNSQATQMKNSINNLHRYAQAQNSVTKIQLYTQLSLNMLNYWDAGYRNVINTELEGHFQTSLQLMNDTALNFTSYRPIFSAKYHEMRLVQSYVLANNTQMLSQLNPSIAQTLAQFGGIRQFLYNQTIHYEDITKSVSQNMSYHLNTSIILTILFIIIFWVFGVKWTYERILDDHLITFEMRNIMGDSLAKDLPITDHDIA